MLWQFLEMDAIPLKAKQGSAAASKPKGNQPFIISSQLEVPNMIIPLYKIKFKAFKDVKI